MTVGLYARVSTGSEDQAGALEQQQARLEAAANGAEPCWYVDIESGSTSDRPELSRLLADCAAGLVTEVIVTRLDRLSRSSSHGAELLRYFAQPTSPNLRALDDSLDLGTPGGRFMARLLISWAEAETDRLGERTRHGHAYRRRLGRPFGSRARPLFGYRFTEDHTALEADPERWPIAQELVRRFLERPVLGELLSWCRDQHGVVWGSNYSLRRWLSNPSLTGARVYGQSQRVKDEATGRVQRIHNPPGQYGDILWADERGNPFQPPLLSREQHARILSVFHARAGSHTRALEPGKVRILTGLVMCGCCGRRMHRRLSNTASKRPYIRCQAPACDQRWSNSIKESEVLNAAMATLGVHASQLAANLDQIQAAKTGAMPPAATELQQKIDTLVALDDPDLLPVIDRKRAELQRLLERSSNTGSGIATFAAQAETFKKPGFWLHGLQHDAAGLRRLLQLYLQKIVVEKKRVAEIHVAETIRIPGHDGILEIED